MVAVYLCLPSGAPQLAANGGGFSWQKLRRIFGESSVLVYAVLAIGVYTPLSVLADLWGPAFLMKKYQIPKSEAAFSCTLLFVGLSLGSLILPALCERWQRLDRAIQICSFSLLGFFGLLLYGPELSLGGLRLVLFAIGVCCSAEMMCFTGAVQATTAGNSGLTLGLVNTLNMFGGALLQQSIGSVLDWQWLGLVDENGVRVYSAEQFGVALSLLFGIILCCSLLSLRLRKA
jgi:sugar phosphate permease